MIIAKVTDPQNRSWWGKWLIAIGLSVSTAFAAINSWTVAVAFVGLAVLVIGAFLAFGRSE